MQAYSPASGGKALSIREREVLFAKFKESLAQSKAEQASVR